MHAEDAAQTQTLVSVIVVTHNNERLINDCIAAVRRSVPAPLARLIVIDNASSDSTCELVRSVSPPVELIALERNEGFARAVNHARDHVRTPYIALVNSDAFPDPGCIERLVTRMQADPRIGIVGARLRYPSGRLQPAAGTFPSLLGDLWVALFLHHVPGLSRLGIGYFADARLYERPREVDWVSGAVCAARIEAGPLPASSFMYGEDVEWARSCRAAGLRVWLEPYASAVHIGRASVDASHDAAFVQRQRAQFELEWFTRSGRAAALLARAVLVVHALARIALYSPAALIHRGDRRVTEYAALLRAALGQRQSAVGDG
jgi:GT2 family glycosyltransferase